MYKYAGIIINSDAVSLDRIFTYLVPENLSSIIQIGFRIYVPFGNSNRKAEGFVISLFNEYNEEYQIKSIISLCDDYPLLTKNDLTLIEEMHKRYLCTYIDAVRTIIPPGISKGIRVKKEELLYAGSKPCGKFIKQPYCDIYESVLKNEGVFNKHKLFSLYGYSLSSMNTMIKHGYLICKDSEVERVDKREFDFYEKKTLNNEQKNAFDEIINSSEKIFLIHGVTGSGKTEIYLNLAQYMISKEKESIILVPEISLTPQLVERFKGRFGNKISVFHSRLSDGERFDEWFRVKNGKVKVAIGARSAVFLPFNKLGLIVIDEEHEGSYKSESNPKYDTREIAEIKSSLYGCKVVLGSATPALDDYYRCMKTQDIKLLTIKERADNAKMPTVDIVDMREELLNNNKSMFSLKLLSAIKDRLLKKEQIILFLNRRGHSSFVSCRKCGHVFKCSNCDISLTYHQNENLLVCHYCGKVMNVPKVCPVCKSRYVKYFGTGTEKVESEAIKLFPKARILRMDKDTTTKKNSYEKIYNDFKDGKADILIGTQMIAKGFDFKNVTLVGVIAADLSLNLPDFRASERTFQLITQVSGRAGRGKKNGEVIVQTYTPTHYSIKDSAETNYEAFYENELKIREALNYPPFSKILCINMSSSDKMLLINKIQNIADFIRKIIGNYDDIEMLGPNPCGIAYIKQKHRWQIILKGNFDYDFINMIKDGVYNSLKNCYNNLRINLDINPNSLI